MKEHLTKKVSIHKNKLSIGKKYWLKKNEWTLKFSFWYWLVTVMSPSLAQKSFKTVAFVGSKRSIQNNWFSIFKVPRGVDIRPRENPCLNFAQFSLWNDPHIACRRRYVRKQRGFVDLYLLALNLQIQRLNWNQIWIFHTLIQSLTMICDSDLNPKKLASYSTLAKYHDWLIIFPDKQNRSSSMLDHAHVSPDPVRKGAVGTLSWARIS